MVQIEVGLMVFSSKQCLNEIPIGNSGLMKGELGEDGGAASWHQRGIKEGCTRNLVARTIEGKHCDEWQRKAMIIHDILKGVGGTFKFNKGRG